MYLRNTKLVEMETVRVRNIYGPTFTDSESWTIGIEKTRNIQLSFHTEEIGIVIDFHNAIKVHKYKA